MPKASDCSPSGPVPRRRLNVLAMLVVTSALFGCTDVIEKSEDFDRHRFSGLTMPYDRPGTIYFDVKFNVDFPADSPEAEAVRMRWLAGWLKQRGLCPAGFDVTKRRPFDYLEDNPRGYQERWEVTCRAPLPEK
jgi:hypothetical protein